MIREKSKFVGKAWEELKPIAGTDNVGAPNSVEKKLNIRPSSMREVVEA